MCRVSSEGKCKYCNFHHTHNLSHLNIITNGHYVINTLNNFRLTGRSEETQSIEQCRWEMIVRRLELELELEVEVVIVVTSLSDVWT